VSPMARKKKKKKKKAHKTVKKCRSLIVINEKPIRRKAINKCKYILKKYETIVNDLDRYDRIDNPGFQQWLHAEFGRQLTTLREIQEKIFQQEELIQHIEYLHWYEGLTLHKAHQKAVDMMENPENFQNDEEDYEEDYQEEFDDDIPDEDFFRSIMEEFLNNFEDVGLHKDIFSKLNNDFKKYQKSEALKNKSSNLFQENEDTHLKSIYRNLAGKLHPDKRDESNKDLDELWFQVQKAYQEGNLEELKTLQAGYEIHNTRSFSGLSLSSILAVHEHYKEQLRILRYRHRKLKTSLIWGFSTLSENMKKDLYKSVKKDLSYDTDESRQYLESLELKIRQYSEPEREKTIRKKTSYISDKQLSLFDDLS
jgi:hypothetical protein